MLSINEEEHKENVGRVTRYLEEAGELCVLALAKSKKHILDGEHSKEKRQMERHISECVKRIAQIEKTCEDIVHLSTEESFAIILGLVEVAKKAYLEAHKAEMIWSNVSNSPDPTQADPAEEGKNG